MEDKNFDRSIRARLERFQPEVPEGLWERIERGLNEEQKAVPIRSKTRRIFPWLQIAASVVLLLGALIGYINRPRTVIYLRGNLSSEASNLKPKGPNEKSQTNVFSEEKKNLQGIKKIAKLAKEEARKLQKGCPEEQKGEEMNGIDAAETAQVAEFNHRLLAAEVHKPSIEKIEAENSVPITITTNQLPTTLMQVAKTERKERSRKDLGVSDILNYIVGAVDKEEKRIVKFSHDEEGTLSVAFDLKAMKVKL